MMEDPIHPSPLPATILLVEDDLAILDGVAGILELDLVDYVVTVLQATNGEEGLAILEHATPDLIISDIRMPRLNGYDFLEQVRQRAGLVHVPFIFLTAYSSRDDIYRGRLSGAELYITKPIEDYQRFVEQVKGQLDIGMRRRMAREEKTRALKQDLLRKLQHEFQTPLTFVTSFYEILAERLTAQDTPQELYEFLRGIQIGSQRLTRLVVDLMMVLELRTGALAQQIQRDSGLIEDSASLVRQAVQAFIPELARRRITVHDNLPADLPPLTGHPASLSAIFEHLIDNAIKFTTRQKETRDIYVTAAVEADCLAIQIRDTGIGFPPEAASLLFEPFYQHNRSHMEQQGAGLGLTIAQGLAALHHGSIEAHSVEGEGSTFTVRLPLRVDESNNPYLPHQAPPSAVRILVVEDEPEQRQALIEIITQATSKYQYQLETAAGGEAALNLLPQFKPDLILSDIGMPDLNGYDLLEQVRQNDAWVELPFVFLTGYNDILDIHRGSQLGVDEYVTKPYNPNELILILETVLDRYFRRQQATVQRFDDLKQQILLLLNQDVLQPLNRVANSAGEMTQALMRTDNLAGLQYTLANIQKDSQRLSEMVDDFTTLLEIQIGASEAAFRLHAGPIQEPDRLLLSACQQARNVSQRPLIPIHNHLPTPLPPIWGEVRTLTQAFRRLAQVALAYGRTSANSSLHLKAALQERVVVFELQLEGAALSSEASALIREYLAMHPPPTLNPTVALVPSLAIARALIDIQHGLILFEEQPQPDGFRFNIHLPRYDPTDPAHSQP